MYYRRWHPSITCSETRDAGNLSGSTQWRRRIFVARDALPVVVSRSPGPSRIGAALTTETHIRRNSEYCDTSCRVAACSARLALVVRVLGIDRHHDYGHAIDRALSCLRRAPRRDFVRATTSRPVSCETYLPVSLARLLSPTCSGMAQVESDVRS